MQSFIHYFPTLQRAGRNVAITGEGIVEVAQNASKPFTVFP